MSTTTGVETAAREVMASFVGALADNKAALGRRYSEWAISAPTLESAVAAAAMAQDELGHARSTYPVLKALGAEGGEDEGFAGDRRLALLDDLRGQLGDGDGAAGPQDPPGGGLPPGARRGLGQAPVPVR
jgi:Phenylacetic acid catabolic protein